MGTSQTERHSVEENQNRLISNITIAIIIILMMIMKTIEIKGLKRGKENINWPIK